MDHRVPRVGLVVSIVCAVLAGLTFLYLNQAFEGPSPTNLISHPYHLEATFKDTEVLQTKQAVLVRGLDVGKVIAVNYDSNAKDAQVTFTVDTDTVPIYKDASVFVGERTILGDPYLNLDPGTQGAGAAPSGFEVAGKPSVNFDQALSFLDAKGRAHVRSLLRTLTQAGKVPDAGEKLNGTVYELTRTVHQLRELTGALKGQESDLAGLVSDSSTVLHELGSREQSLRTIVAAGRTTLDALGSHTRSVEQAVAETPSLLATGRHVLRESRPLFRESLPLVNKLNAAAPDLKPILDQLPQLSADTVDVVSHLSGIPTLRKTLEVVKIIGPLVPALEAATRNLVPQLQYMAPRTKSLSSFFANMASATAHGDSIGRWARFYIGTEPGELTDNPLPNNCAPGQHPTIGVCHNAYPKPGDAKNNQPYVKGSYPRLRPFNPP
jgi:phospholipid/cholesterol/gamma-HCH transport system substrate-binding protein